MFLECEKTLYLAFDYTEFAFSFLWCIAASKGDDTFKYKIIF